MKRAKKPKKPRVSDMVILSNKVIQIVKRGGVNEKSSAHKRT